MHIGNNNLRNVSMFNEERKAVNAFLFTCHQMQNTGFGKLFTISPTKTYRLQKNTPHSAKVTKEFTHDEWQAFLIPFRKLLLSADPANFSRVINILSRHGSHQDKLRLREMKKVLKEAASTPGYGVRVLTKESGNWVTLNGRQILDSYINSLVFHNNAETITAGSIVDKMHPFAMSSMFHYVIIAYKQALRVAAAIRIRYSV